MTSAARPKGKAAALSVAEVRGRIDAMIDKRVARYASVRDKIAADERTTANEYPVP